MYWAIGLGGLGAIFGSFIATVAVRWPAPALTGRSRCDGCGRTLAAYELVPILSWLALRGGCRTCGGRIGLLHPVIEMIAAAIGIAAGVAASGAPAVAGAVFGWLLLLAGAIDFVAFRLPNPVTMTIALLGLATGLAGLEPDLTDRAIGGVAGFGVLWLISAAYVRARGRIGLGGGDAKLLGAIGLWLGWRALPWVVLVACMLGLGWAAARRMRRDDRLPFGTVLGAAAFALWLITTSNAGPIG
ncbi:prepilin peptidase [Sphingomonas floccifaciens]|uniref:Prepilin leader peptidase/N-methyltransferase n=1 Tax=Sphingomonas floccifaciens TaxID=1844115 RepID=A0ABW4NF81_9SPHN